MALHTAKITKSGKGWTVTTAEGPKTFEGQNAAVEAMDYANAYNEKLETEANAAPTTGPKVVVGKGKATITASGLGYKGQLFGGYAADWECLLAFFDSPADSPAAKAFAEARPRLCASWQAYGDLAVGATLPDGTLKGAPAGRK